MDLGRGQADAVVLDQGLEHVGDHGGDLRRHRVGDGIGDAVQDRMPHAGDLEYCHERTMVRRARRVKSGGGAGKPYMFEPWNH